MLQNASSMILFILVKAHGNCVENKNCKIEKDLNVYILPNNATGTQEKRKLTEDSSITKLNLKSPNGMNSNIKDFVETFFSLF